ncbi:MAG: hypothetical protein SFZ24_10200, partial [Planctomycetota bacterium]|nr:hypothetical protein [Planctomycetota bacterium]
GLVAPVFPFLTLDMMSADGLISLHGCAGPDASMYGWDVQLLRNRWPHLQWWRFAAWTARNGPRPSWFFGVSAPAWIVIVAALAPDGVRVLRRRRIDPGACACGYDLRGLDPLTSPTCPECGRLRAAEVSGPAARGPAPAGSADPR